MIATITMISAMFGTVIALGLFLVWIHDTLENLWKKSLLRKRQGLKVGKGTLIPAYRVTTYQIPVPQTGTAFSQSLTEDADFRQKIVRIDFRPVSRVRTQDDDLGEHVRVLSRAA